MATELAIALKLTPGMSMCKKFCGLKPHSLRVIYINMGYGETRVLTDSNHKMYIWEIMYKTISENMRPI